MTNPCAICARPQPDQAYACQLDTDRVYRWLGDIADATPAARDVATGQTRRGIATRSNGDGGIPLNLGAGARLDAVQNALTTWARHIVEERGISGPQIAVDGRTGSGEGDPLIASAQWLRGQLGWARHRREIVELHRDIAAARRIIVGIIDRPAGRLLVGACDCGAVLYAKTGTGTVTCRDCDSAWDVHASRDTLRQALDDKLLTAAQVAALAVVADPDLDRQRVRRLVNVWGHRGPGKGGIETRGHSPEGDPLYRFGDARERVLASSALPAA